MAEKLTQLSNYLISTMLLRYLLLVSSITVKLARSSFLSSFPLDFPSSISLLSCPCFYPHHCPSLHINIHIHIHIHNVLIKCTHSFTHSHTNRQTRSQYVHTMYRHDMHEYTYTYTYTHTYTYTNTMAPYLRID